ncbi:hypothetical protein SAMN06265338_11557 [Rhodoblastus acidophilus]|uniref:Uncharacterized protein n=1 Tax=Rhodoblastus acidophilus TaxID=1074 RepID=A0A212S8F1_RHOAC|nr:hypothetical protein [Rhodoblastus acidophilus]PPQ37030.1 hypothetical protein CKO16_15665 [Rhodoblastus acidophilus]RAI20337.1 hypothetical protein CH337_10060 [Rhodoblastus acidophilus]SNB81486.1 hypothetical protein SAMN06265338_11557 [Rhodoblastus acidophilus]
MAISYYPPLISVAVILAGAAAYSGEPPRASADGGLRAGVDRASPGVARLIFAASLPSDIASVDRTAALADSRLTAAAPERVAQGDRLPSGLTVRLASDGFAAPVRVSHPKALRTAER